MVQWGETGAQVRLHQAVFEATPLSNVVGIGNVTAWQVVLTRGPVLATLGQLVGSADPAAANTPCSE